MEFLKLKEVQKLNQITLEYIGNDNMRVFSTSMQPHSIILLTEFFNVLNKYSYDKKIYNYAQKREIFKFFKEICIQGDMIIHISKWDINVLEDCIIYLPVFLTDYQTLSFRIWDEYFKLKKVEYQVYQRINDKDVYYENNLDIGKLLDKYQINNDEYIRSLNKEF